MLFKPKRIVPALLVLFLTPILLQGCSGFVSQRSGQHSISSSLSHFLYPRDNVQVAVKPEIPQLKLPIRVGLAFLPTQNWRGNVLDESTKYQLLNKVKQSFGKHRFIDSISIIPSAYLRHNSGKGSNGFNTMSQVARLHDVDVIALVSYDQLTQSLHNNAALLYWTIVGMYVIPGNENTVQTFVDIAVFDVKSKKMLMRAPGISKLQKRSTAIGVDSVMINKANKGFNLAFDDMIKNLDIELAGFRQRAKEGRVANIQYKTGYSGGGSFSLFLILGLIFLGALNQVFLKKWGIKKAT